MPIQEFAVPPNTTPVMEYSKSQPLLSRMRLEGRKSRKFLGDGDAEVDASANEEKVLLSRSQEIDFQQLSSTTGTNNKKKTCSVYTLSKPLGNKNSTTIVNIE